MGSLCYTHNNQNSVSFTYTQCFTKRQAWPTEFFDRNCRILPFFCLHFGLLGSTIPQPAGQRLYSSQSSFSKNSVQCFQTESFFFFKLYNIVLVLPYIEMNPPQAYTCSPSWTLLPPPSPRYPSGSSQCTSPKHPVSCIEPELATRFISLAWGDAHKVLEFTLIRK